MRKNAQETLENREAFEYYYGLGQNRGLSTVAQKFGKSLLTVKRWSVSFNWVERVKLRDIEIGDQVQKATNAHVVASRAMYRETIGKLVMEFKRSVEAGDIKITKVDDFVKIVNLDLELMGVGSGEDGGNMASLSDILEKSARMIAGKLDENQPQGDIDGGDIIN